MERTWTLGWPGIEKEGCTLGLAIFRHGFVKRVRWILGDSMVKAIPERHSRAMKTKPTVENLNLLFLYLRLAS